MLIDIYRQLLVMSAAGGGIYLVFKLLSPLTRRYFSAAWHDRTALVAYSFFLIPYHKFLSWLDAGFARRLAGGLAPAAAGGGNGPGPVGTVMRRAAIPRGWAHAPILPGFGFLPYLLTAGTLAFLAILLVRSRRLNLRLSRMCRPADEARVAEVLTSCREELGVAKNIPVFVSPAMTTPFLYGVFRPRIVLPDLAFTEGELRCVFLHELTHWKRRDLWLKTLLLFINAVHWFNPLAYVIRRDIDRFREMSCDESVVLKMDLEERRRYCESLLNVLFHVADRNGPFVSAFSSGRRHLERRIEMILKSDGSKGKKWVRSLAAAMSLALALGGTAAAYAASTPETHTVDGMTTTVYTGIWNYESGKAKIDLENKILEKTGAKFVVTIGTLSDKAPAGAEKPDPQAAQPPTALAPYQPYTADWSGTANDTFTSYYFKPAGFETEADGSHVVDYYTANGTFLASVAATYSDGKYRTRVGISGVDYYAVIHSASGGSVGGASYTAYTAD